MVWLSRILNRRIVKGFEYRLKSLEDLMDSCQAQMSELGEKLDMLRRETPEPQESIKKISGEFELWSRMYWDAYNRHDEVTSGLMLVTKDFNRR